MHRRLATVSAVLTVVALGLAPAQAATKKAKPKPKPKPIRGSYTLTLYPDPTYGTVDVNGPTHCDGQLPQGKDDHPFTVPAKGTLKLVLDTPDPTGGATPITPIDWDVYILDSSGSAIDSDASITGHKELTVPFKRGQKVTFDVCNSSGGPNGTVSYVFTYA